MKGIMLELKTSMLHNAIRIKVKKWKIKSCAKMYFIQRWVIHVNIMIGMYKRTRKRDKIRLQS